MINTNLLSIGFSNRNLVIYLLGLKNLLFPNYYKTALHLHAIIQHEVVSYNQPLKEYIESIAVSAYPSKFQAMKIALTTNPSHTKDFFEVLCDKGI